MNAQQKQIGFVRYGHKVFVQVDGGAGLPPEKLISERVWDDGKTPSGRQLSHYYTLDKYPLLMAYYINFGYTLNYTSLVSLFTLQKLTLLRIPKDAHTPSSTILEVFDNSPDTLRPLRVNLFKPEGAYASRFGAVHIDLAAKATGEALTLLYTPPAILQRLLWAYIEPEIFALQEPELPLSPMHQPTE